MILCHVFCLCTVDVVKSSHPVSYPPLQTTVGVGCYNLAKIQPPRSQRTSNFSYRHIFRSRTPRYLENLDQDNYNQ